MSEAGPHGFLQWKNTNACVDVFCACGHQGHVDDWGAYYYVCPACGTVYELSPRITLRALTAEEARDVEPVTDIHGRPPRPRPPTD